MTSLYFDSNYATMMNHLYGTDFDSMTEEELEYLELEAENPCE